MLHLISGKSDDRKQYIQQLLAQDTLMVHHIYDNDLTELEIQDLVKIQTGLFEEKEVFVIHDLARDLDLKNLLLGYAESDNIIIFSETSVTKKIAASFEKVSASIHDFGKEMILKEEKMNIFALADALGNRDKKKLWLLFQDAIKQASAEEIHGILFWQIKNMLLVAGSSSNPGLNSFVYQKNQTFVQKWERQELIDYSARFVSVFHTRDNYRTLEIDLEKIIISI